MNITDDMSFDEWFDIFVDTAKNLGYDGPIDKYTFESDYAIDNRTPEAAAKLFVNEMNE